MRLIDADTLLENAEYDEHYRLIVRAESIRNAPTIEAEPVRHGEWLPAGRGIRACSRCNHGIQEHMVCVNKYCPNCGAKMKAGGQHE